MPEIERIVGVIELGRLCGEMLIRILFYSKSPLQPLPQPPLSLSMIEIHLFPDFMVVSANLTGIGRIGTRSS